MINYFKEKIFPKSISKKEATDTGMAMALVMLLLGYFTKNSFYYLLAIPLLVIDMTFPMFYYPFAMIWLGVTNLLGTVVSRILLTIVYLIILLPTGVIRRLMRKDSLQLNDFKNNTNSVMITRDHNFTANDIINPF